MVSANTVLRSMRANVAAREQAVKEGSVLRNCFDASPTLATSVEHAYLVKAGL